MYYPPRSRSSGIIRMWPGSSTGLRKLGEDVRVGGRWAKERTVKEYKKYKSLRGSKIYKFKDGDFIRYTVVFQNGDMYILSENPLSPMGVSDFKGNIFEDRRLRPMGKKITIDKVPWEVRRAIKMIMEG